MTSSFTVSSARPNELGAAFDLIFKQYGATERRARVAEALQLVRQRELPPEGVWVARRGTQLVGALVCLILPGASGLIWPPQVAAGIDATEMEDQLTEDACAWLRGRDAKLAQALLTDEEKRLAAPLERNGFKHITSLWYLRCDRVGSSELSRKRERLRYQPWTTTREVFQETLLRTYEGTLDCPEVNGVRTIDEILAGHRGQRTDDPATWWLAFEDDRAVGVVLVSEIPEGGAWDLSYLGVIPEVRECGVGRELVRKVQSEAQLARVRSVSLSVDTRNRPAWRLYLGAGFEPYDRREVYLAVWR
jgi:ribosomal protein S18 acetylase RimI-like enzyme